jgi:DNA-binding NtrC family response regulator
METSTGQQAVALMQATNLQGVVVLNYQLPGLDGVTLLEKVAPLQVLAARHTFILCSAFELALLVKRSEQLMQRIWLRFLPKPFSLGDLSTLAGQAMQRRRWSVDREEGHTDLCRLFHISESSPARKTASRVVVQRAGRYWRRWFSCKRTAGLSKPCLELV